MGNNNKTGIIDHVMINANHYDKAVTFYSWLFKRLGYSKDYVYKEPPRTIGWVGFNNSIWLMESNRRFRSIKFDKTRVGLRELSFSATSRREVDSIAKEIIKHGGKVLDKPKEYPQYSKGYYSVFFTDPDGVKLEVVSKEHALW